MEESKGFIVIYKKQEKEPVQRVATIFALTESHPLPEEVLNDLGVVNLSITV